MKNTKKHSIVTVLATALVFGLSGPTAVLAADSTDPANPTAQTTNPTTVNLGTSDSFAVLAGTAITDVPTSTITGDVGLSPGTGAAIGVGCAEVTGTIYDTNGTYPGTCEVTNPGLLTGAKNDLTTAYLDAAGRTPNQTFVAGDNQLGGQTLGQGVYRFGHASTANIIGTLTLSGDASSVFIFQATSDLVTASSSVVLLTGGAQACNVFWQIGSSTTLGTNSTFVGTIMSLTATGLNTGVTLDGRAMARNAAVTLDSDTITRRPCAAVTTPGSGTPGSGSGAAAATDTGEVTPMLPNAGIGPRN